MTTTAQGYDSYDNLTVAPHSHLFDAPGRPRPLARRLAVHNAVVRSIRTFFFDTGFHEMPVTALADHPARVQLEGMIAQGFKAVWCESEILPRGGRLDPKYLRGFKLIEADQQGLSLDQLADMCEQLLKYVASQMSADLLGGRHVTRLDRAINIKHRRISYQQALEILAEKDIAIRFGEALDAPALAALTRHVGNVPFILTHLPECLKLPGALSTPGQTAVCESCQYILPYAGLAMDGSLRDAPGAPAGFSLDLGRLLQYLMGLADIADTVIDPMNRVVSAMQDTPPGTISCHGGGRG
ncbi:MAG: aspartyl/asparaginyl-tRNA synthetase [Candidatus Krumholzibacteriia bacterium]|jgi:aspartyl/asparaginyl-tRNA synthetase